MPVQRNSTNTGWTCTENGATYYDRDFYRSAGNLAMQDSGTAATVAARAKTDAYNAAQDACKQQTQSSFSGGYAAPSMNINVGAPQVITNISNEASPIQATDSTLGNVANRSATAFTPESSVGSFGVPANLVKQPVLSLQQNQAPSYQPSGGQLTGYATPESYGRGSPSPATQDASALAPVASPATAPAAQTNVIEEGGITDKPAMLIGLALGGIALIAFIAIRKNKKR